MSKCNYFPYAWFTTALCVTSALVYCTYCMMKMPPLYMLHQSNVTWFEASRNCTNQGRRLVTFSDFNEALDLSAYLDGKNLNISSLQNIWLGRMVLGNGTGDWRDDFVDVNTGAPFPSPPAGLVLYNYTIHDRNYHGYCKDATYFRNIGENVTKYTLNAAKCNSLLHYVCKKYF